MTPSTTKSTEREQWRARILRALAELGSEPRPEFVEPTPEEVSYDNTPAKGNV